MVVLNWSWLLMLIIINSSSFIGSSVKVVILKCAFGKEYQNSLGYEIKNQKTGILANGYFAFQFAQLIRNWTKDLTIFTNGKSELTQEQTDKIKKHNISIV